MGMEPKKKGLKREDFDTEEEYKRYIGTLGGKGTKATLSAIARRKAALKEIMGD